MTVIELELICLDPLNLSQLVWYSPVCNVGDEVDEFLLPSTLKKNQTSNCVSATSQHSWSNILNLPNSISKNKQKDIYYLGSDGYDLSI